MDDYELFRLTGQLNDSLEKKIEKGVVDEILDDLSKVM